MDSSHIERLKEFEEDILVYSYLALDNKILKSVIEKAIEPELKKELVTKIVKDYEISITRTCSLMSIHRSYFYYVKKKLAARVKQAFVTPGSPKQTWSIDFARIV